MTHESLAVMILGSAALLAGLLAAAIKTLRDALAEIREVRRELGGRP